MYIKNTLSSMRVYIAVTAVLLTLAVHSAIVSAQTIKDRQTIFDLSFDDSSYGATDGELKEIDALIDALKGIDSPDFGFSETFSGTTFSPVDGTQDIGTELMGIDQGLKNDSSVLRLVKFGPKAITSLLNHLDDATPTKYVCEHSGMMGAMWYSSEIEYRENNPFEKLPEEPQSQAEAKFPNHIKEHKLTVGDVCFATLGQIVNRSYQAMRYQPTFCLVINSPTHDPKIGASLRKTWQCDDPAKRLFESLCSDYATDDRCGDAYAAVRLVYYFPKETVPYFVDKISKVLDDKDTEGDKDTEDRCDEDRALELVRIMSNVDSEEISDTIAKLVENSIDNELVLDCITPVFIKRHRSLVLRLLQSELLELTWRGSRFDIDHKSEIAARDTDWTWLNIALKHFPDEAEGIFVSYLKDERQGSDLMVIDTLAEAEVPLPWAVKVLKPFLNDTRNSDRKFGELRPARICDLAAGALVRHVPGATFHNKGDVDYFDRQIKNIQAVLEGKPTTPLPEEYVVDLEKLPQLTPDKTFTLERSGVINAFSTAETLYIGERQIDVSTGTLTNRYIITPWHKRGQELRSYQIDRGLYFDAKDEGSFKEFDLKTGEMIRRVPSKFTDRWKRSDGHFGIHGWGDVAVIGNNEAVIVAVEDGTVYSFDLDQKTLKTVYTNDRKFQADLTTLEGTRLCLVETTFQRPMLWDYDKQEMRDLDQVPEGAWSSLFDGYAVNRMNGRVELWNLLTQKEIALHLPEDAVIDDIAGNKNLWCFVTLADGRCYMLDLKSNTPICVLKLHPPGRNTEYIITTDGKWLICNQDLSVWDNKANQWTEAKTEISLFAVDKIEHLRSASKN